MTHLLFKNAMVLFVGWWGVAAAAQADLVDLIAKAKPSIVIIGTYNPTDSPRFNLGGTGFVVGDGQHVITNAHVLARALGATGTMTELKVMIPGQSDNLEMRPATIVKSTPNRDLAVLKINGPALPALRLAGSSYAAEGSAVAFIGFPIGGALGYSPVAHRGIISSVTTIAPPQPTARQLNEQAIKRLRDGSFDIYQLDAIAYPGNSGGPLLNVETGEVIGIINMVLIRGSKESALSHPTGISYAIPVKFVNELLERP